MIYILFLDFVRFTIEYTAKIKARERFSQPRPWCNDSGVLNLQHGYYTTIMTSRKLFRHNPVSHGTNQSIRKSEFVQCMKVIIIIIIIISFEVLNKRYKVHYK